MKKWVLVLSCLLLSGCSTIPQVLESSKCNPPCWRDITMGESKESALKKISNMEDIDQGTVEFGYSNREYQEEYASWTFKSKNDFGYIGFHDSKVSCLYFDAGHSIALKEIIKMIGGPDLILTSKYRLDGEYITADFIYTEGVSLLFEQSILPIFSPKELKITPNTKISVIFFYDPKLIGKDKYMLVGVNDVFSPDSKTYEWRGYGSYKFIDEN